MSKNTKTKKTAKPKTKAAKKPNKLSDETRAKISKALKGLTPWNKNKKTGVKPWNAGLKLDKKTGKFVPAKKKSR